MKILTKRKEYKGGPNRNHRTENRITKLKNTIEGFKLDEEKARFHELKDRAVELMQLEQKKKKNSEDSLGDLKDNIKQTKTHIIEFSESEERKKGVENLIKEIIAKNVPVLRNKTYIHIQDSQRVLNKRNSKTPTLRHIITEMSKVKDKEGILKGTREKQFVTNKRTSIRLSKFFSRNFAD